MGRKPKPIPTKDYIEMCRMQKQGSGARVIAREFKGAYHVSRVGRALKKCPEIMESAGGREAVANALEAASPLAISSYGIPQSNPSNARSAPSPLGVTTVGAGHESKSRMKATTRNLEVKKEVFRPADSPLRPPTSAVLTSYTSPAYAPFGSDVDDDDSDDDDDDLDMSPTFNNYPGVYGGTYAYVPGAKLATLPLVMMKTMEDRVVMDNLKKFDAMLDKKFGSPFPQTNIAQSPPTEPPSSRLSQEVPATLQDLRDYVNSNSEKEETPNDVAKTGIVTDEPARTCLCSAEIPTSDSHMIDSSLDNALEAEESTSKPTPVPEDVAASVEKTTFNSQQIGLTATATSNMVGAGAEPPSNIIDQNSARQQPLSTIPPTATDDKKPNRDPTRIEGLAAAPLTSELVASARTQTPSNDNQDVTVESTAVTPSVPGSSGLNAEVSGQDSEAMGPVIHIEPETDDLPEPNSDAAATTTQPAAFDPVTQSSQIDTPSVLAEPEAGERPVSDGRPNTPTADCAVQPSVANTPSNIQTAVPTTDTQRDTVLHDQREIQVASVNSVIGNKDNERSNDGLLALLGLSVLCVGAVFYNDYKSQTSRMPTADQSEQASFTPPQQGSRARKPEDAALF